MSHEKRKSVSTRHVPLLLARGCHRWHLCSDLEIYLEEQMLSLCFFSFNVTPSGARTTNLPWAPHAGGWRRETPLQPVTPVLITANENPKGRKQNWSLPRVTACVAGTMDSNEALSEMRRKYWRNFVGQYVFPSPNFPSHQTPEMIKGFVLVGP